MSWYDEPWSQHDEQTREVDEPRGLDERPRPLREQDHEPIVNMTRAGWMILGGLALGVIGGLIAWNGRAKPGVFDDLFGLPPAEPNMGAIVVGVGIVVVGFALLIAGLIGVATRHDDR